MDAYNSIFTVSSAWHAFSPAVPEECLATESDLADSVDLQTFSSLQFGSFDIENGRHKLVSAVRLKFWTQFLEQF